MEKLYQFLSKYKLTRKPGETYLYSNIGAGLLGHVLALKAGMSSEQAPYCGVGVNSI
jgi:CubicO group peptidase (beta-lactamase class C family)